jgi:hypothetical protein
MQHGNLRNRSCGLPGISAESRRRFYLQFDIIILPAARAITNRQLHRMEEVPSISVSVEGFMTEVPAFSVGSRRDEDIALDLMKFVAMTTGYGRTSTTGVGFQGGGAASKPEDYATHLLELYGRCLGAVHGKR